MNGLFSALLDAILDAGTIMSESELVELAYGPYGETEWVEDAEGNLINSRRICTRKGLQEIADVYTDGFDCINF